jgi:hypothetical protein
LVALLDVVYFLLRYVPFWAIPLIIIFLQLAYLYWLKGIRIFFYLLVGLSCFLFLVVIFYIYAGGPDGTVRYFNELVGILTT